MERLNEFWQNRLSKNMRSWMGEFLNREQFSLPESYAAMQSRLVNNIGYFHSNYLVVVLVLVFYCILQHILLAFLLLSVIFAYFFVSNLPEDYNLQLGGMLVTKKSMFIGITIFSILIFLFTNVGGAFFWLVGITALIVGLHAIMHEVAIESDFGQTV